MPLSIIFIFLYYQIELCSSLTEGEKALIEAQYIHETDTDFQCKRKAYEQANRHGIDYDEALKRQRVRGRCENRKLTTDSGITYHRCFCFFQHPDFDMFFQIYSCFEKGILPFPGSVFEQPAWAFEVINLYTKLSNEYQERERAKQERTIKNGKR